MDSMDTYYAFLLRIWHGTPENPLWRASLEDPHTRQMIYFASVEALCAFLSQPDPTLFSSPSFPPSKESHEP